MTTQEMQDIDTLRRETQEAKLNCFRYLESLDTADARELETSGYGGKTNAEAMQLAFQSYKKLIKKMLDAHIRKYPD